MGITLRIMNEPSLDFEFLNLHFYEKVEATRWGEKKGVAWLITWLKNMIRILGGGLILDKYLD